MAPILASVSSLLVGVFFFMMGNSLLNIVLPVKMKAAGIATEMTGLVMAGYFAGLLVGCVYGKTLIFRVGHIRAFAGLAALNVGVVLGHAMLLDPYSWIVLRFISGLTIAGIFAALESWLNDRTDNATRGMVLGTYMVITYIAMLGGQLAINIWPLEGSGALIAAALLGSLAIVPVALTRIEAPSLAAARPFGLRELYETSPLATVATVMGGIMVGAHWGMAAIFAREIGFGVFETSLFTGAYLVGGMVFQIPIGRLSDHFDRRTVLSNLLAGAVVVCAAGLAAQRFGNPVEVMLLLSALLGGALSNIYPLTMAQAFDYLDRDQYVAAASRLLMVFSAGAVAGPLIASAAMGAFGPHAYFAVIGAGAAGLVGFVFYRMLRRRALPVEQQEEFVPMPRLSPEAAALHPEAELGAEEPEPRPVARPEAATT
jgi:MFS family permease